MAAIRNSFQIREKLKVLECPYLESLDDVTTHELLFSNGEARLRLLEWLLNKYDPLILKRETPTNNHITKLTLLFSELQLCSPKDYELIEGNGGTVKSLMFWEALTDLVTVCSCSNEKIVQNVTNCYRFIDDVCRCHGNLSTVFPNSINLLPPTLCHVINKRESKSTVPSLNELNDQIDQLHEQLRQDEIIFRKLTEKYEYLPVDTTMDTCCTSINLTLVTLNQLIDNFMQSYHLDVHHWTRDKVLSQFEEHSIGSTAHKLYTNLSLINQLLDSIDKLTKFSSILVSLGKQSLSSQGNQLYKRTHSSFEELIEDRTHLV